MPVALKPSPVETEPAPYVMPRPDRGQRVIFHRNCIKNSITDSVGYVDDVSPMNITLIVAGRMLESVPHCSDPRVKENPNLRENGMWDFSPSDKAINDRLEKLESQMADLLK